MNTNTKMNRFDLAKTMAEDQYAVRVSQHGWYNIMQAHPQANPPKLATFIEKVQLEAGDDMPLIIRPEKTPLP